MRRAREPARKREDSETEYTEASCPVPAHKLRRPTARIATIGIDISSQPFSLLAAETVYPQNIPRTRKVRPGFSSHISPLNARALTARMTYGREESIR